jgi:hypothetical protein
MTGDVVICDAVDIYTLLSLEMIEEIVREAATSAIRGSRLSNLVCLDVSKVRE